MRLLLKKGAPSGARIAETFFEPHSETSPRRQGIGSQVLEAILSDAQKRGIKAIYADVTNTIARDFFIRNGFERAHNAVYYRAIP